MTERGVDCSECKTIHLSVMEEPPCDSCFPSVNNRNIIAWYVYQDVKNQLMYTMNGAAGLDVKAVDVVLNMYQVEDQESRLDIWHKLQIISNTSINAKIKKQEEKHGSPSS